MELHTLGVDGGYTQKDVIEVARAFTGWTIDSPRQGGGFRFEPRMHDDGEKIVLGHTIKAGGGERDGEQVLDILAAHPSTARFIATKLARRFVSDDAAAGARRSRGRDVPRDRRRPPRGRAHDRHLAGVLRAGRVSREGEDAVRVRRQRAARDRRRRADAHAARAARCASSGMPLYLCQPPTGYADTRRRLGQHRRAPQPDELRASTLASGQLRGVRVAAALGDSRRCARAIVSRRALAGDRLGVRRASTVAQARPRRRRPSRSLLGSPEFQKR